MSRTPCNAVADHHGATDPRLKIPALECQPCVIMGWILRKDRGCSAVVVLVSVKKILVYATGVLDYMKFVLVYSIGYQTGVRARPGERKVVQGVSGEKI